MSDNSIRKDFKGIPEAAAPYMHQAAKILAGVKEQIALGVTSQMVKTVTLRDGTTVRASAGLGQDKIEIFPIASSPVNADGEHLPTDTPEALDESPTYSMAMGHHYYVASAAASTGVGTTVTATQISDGLHSVERTPDGTFVAKPAPAAVVSEEPSNWKRLMGGAPPSFNPRCSHLTGEDAGCFAIGGDGNASFVEFPDREHDRSTRQDQTYRVTAANIMQDDIKIENKYFYNVSTNGSLIATEGFYWSTSGLALFQSADGVNWTVIGNMPAYTAVNQIGTLNSLRFNMTHSDTHFLTGVWELNPVAGVNSGISVAPAVYSTDLGVTWDIVQPPTFSDARSTAVLSGGCLLSVRTGSRDTPGTMYDIQYHVCAVGASWTSFSLSSLGFDPTTFPLIVLSNLVSVEGKFRCIVNGYYPYAVQAMWQAVVEISYVNGGIHARVCDTQYYPYDVSQVYYVYEDFISRASHMLAWCGSPIGGGYTMAIVSHAYTGVVLGTYLCPLDGPPSRFTPRISGLTAQFTLYPYNWAFDRFLLGGIVNGEWSRIVGGFISDGISGGFSVIPQIGEPGFGYELFTVGGQDMIMCQPDWVATVDLSTGVIGAQQECKAASNTQPVNHAVEQIRRLNVATYTPITDASKGIVARATNPGYSGTYVTDTPIWPLTQPG